MESMLERLKELVKNSEDQDTEDILQDAEIDYEVYEKGDWVVDYKYQLRSISVIIEGKYYDFNESRSGSPFSSYYYIVSDVAEFIPDTRYHVTYTFPNKEVAKDFTRWMCNSGEQMMWEYSEGSDSDLLREIEYNYDEGSLEIKEKFE